MKDAKGHGSDPRGGSAHQQGVNKVGSGFRLNSFTHEIVSPTGEVAARMKLGKNTGLSVDQRGVGSIARSGGTAIHDAVGMAAYNKNEFPAEHISTELHYLTGNEFKGHTVRLATSGPNKADAFGRTAADLKKDYKP